MSLQSLLKLQCGRPEFTPSYSKLLDFFEVVLASVYIVVVMTYCHVTNSAVDTGVSNAM